MTRESGRVSPSGGARRAVEAAGSRNAVRRLGHGLPPGVRSADVGRTSAKDYGSGSFPGRIRVRIGFLATQNKPQKREEGVRNPLPIAEDTVWLAFGERH